MAHIPKKTLRQMLLVLLVSLLLSGMVFLSNMGRTQLVNGTGLRRNGYGQAEKASSCRCTDFCPEKHCPSP